MPPQRAHTRTRGPELTPVQRAEISGMSKAGMTPTQIARATGHSRGAVRSTLERQHVRVDHKTVPREGGPKLHSERDCRLMGINMKKHPQLTYDERLEDTGLKMGRALVNAIAKDLGFVHMPAAKGQQTGLSEEQAAVRLAWCRDKEKWTVAKWRTVMWSGECLMERSESVRRGTSMRRAWVYSQSDDRQKRKNVPSKEMRIMVSAMFWGEKRRSKLFIRRLDDNAVAYKALLEMMLVPNYKPGLMFMQDNAPTHTARIIKDLFTKERITALDWPPHSPDLNPMTQAWVVLKRNAAKICPNKWNAKGISAKARAELEEYLCEVWETIPDSVFEGLVQSMPDRIAACIAAKGFHFSYKHDFD